MKILIAFSTIFALSLHAVMIEKGPFKGKDAKWDEEIKGWVIAGDISKAPEMEKYDGKSFTGGVTMRKIDFAVDVQGGFKKIWLQQGSETEWYDVPAPIIDLDANEIKKLRKEKLETFFALEKLAASNSQGDYDAKIDSLKQNLEGNAKVLDYATKIQEMFSTQNFGDDLKQKIGEFKTYVLGRFDAVSKIKELLDSGFGVITGSLERLQDGGPASFERSENIILFHPKVPKAARFLYQMRHENNADEAGWNTYEEGLLLGYADVDVESFVFGSKEAKRNFPSVEFSRESIQFENPQKLLWRKIGKSRLKQELGDEYEWVVGEYQN